MTGRKCLEMADEIVLYTLSTCPVCKTVRRMLESHGIDHRVVEVDLLDEDARRRQMQDLRTRAATVAFPFLVAGSKVVVGNEPEKIRGALGLPPPEKKGVLERLYPRSRSR